MKQYQDWVQIVLSEDQIYFISDGTVVAGEDNLVYYISAGNYYRSDREQKEFYITFNPSILPKYAQEVIIEMSVWTLDRIYGIETTMLYPVNGANSLNYFHDSKYNEYLYSNSSIGEPHKLKILVDSPLYMDANESKGYPKVWETTKGRFKFPDGQIIDFK